MCPVAGFHLALVHHYRRQHLATAPALCIHSARQHPPLGSNCPVAPCCGVFASSLAYCSWRMAPLGQRLHPYVHVKVRPCVVTDTHSPSAKVWRRWHPAVLMGGRGCSWIICAWWSTSAHVPLHMQLYAALGCNLRPCAPSCCYWPASRSKQHTSIITISLLCRQSQHCCCALSISEVGRRVSGGGQAWKSRRRCASLWVFKLVRDIDHTIIPAQGLTQLFPACSQKLTGMLRRHDMQARIRSCMGN